MTFYTDFEEGSNFMFRCLGPESMTMKKEKGWMSTSYMKKAQRMNVSFNVRKHTDATVRYITVIYPKTEAGRFPSIDARFKSVSPDRLKIQVRLDGKKRTLEYDLGL